MIRNLTAKEFRLMKGCEVRHKDSKESEGIITGTSFPCGLETVNMFFVRRWDGSNFGADSWSFCEDYVWRKNHDADWKPIGVEI